MSDKDRLIEMKEREFLTTLKVLNAYPRDKQDLKPHPTKSKSAVELAFNFMGEETVAGMIIEGKVDWSKVPKKEGTIDDAIAVYEKEHAKSMVKLKAAGEEDYQKPITFFGEEMRRIDALMAMLMDAVHHRGQFSVYIRLADGKVPMIYGPTADEPWEGPADIK